MVLINAGRRGSAMSSTNTGLGQRRNPRRGYYDRERVGAWALSAIAIGYLAFSIYTSTRIFYTGGGDKIRREDQQGFFDRQRRVVDPDHPALQLSDPDLSENADFFDSHATDILQTLNCHTLLAGHSRTYNRDGIPIYGIDEKRRRLRADAVAQDDVSNEGRFADDDRVFGTFSNAMVTGAHLFCLAAFPQMTDAGGLPVDNNSKDETAFWKDKVKCRVRGDKQQAILDLWSTARAEIPDTDVLIKTLQFAAEQSITLVDKQLNVWAAPDDTGTEFMTNDLNEQAYRQSKGDYGGIAGLADNLGSGKLFVDVGSGLGYTAMAVAILYPGTEIVSIEAAPTNWLLQEMNWRCNDFDQKQQHKKHNVKVLLTGVGPSTGTSQMAKFVWRPTGTTSTRAWSLNLEENAGKVNPAKSEDDLEVTVKLRPWHSIQSEADIRGRDIDVLNVDCEGCEYNLIPALAAADFESIRAIMGQVHWGYIPRLKLPSSKRGKETHERLCRHENFARSSIECCAFPDLPVRSSFSGEVLVVDSKQFPPKESTVKDLAGPLCDNFAKWAVDHNLNNIESDWAWFQIESMRETL